MRKALKKIKDTLYSTIVEGNPGIKYEYEKYVKEHIDEHGSDRIQHWIILLWLNFHYRLLKKDDGLIYRTKQNKTFLVDYYKHDIQRCSVDMLCQKLSEYDVISFDIFDTVIFRKVEYPNDVFDIMSAEMGFNDFTNVRKKGESMARDDKERKEGTREVSLKEIYDVLNSVYGIEYEWMDREIELELNLSSENPYIKEVYNHLLKLNKTIIFMSDMYLPSYAIVKMLIKNGYEKFEKLYLSNEIKYRKGDGKLQKILLNDYRDKKIIHIGDNLDADYKKSIEAGLDAIYNPISKLSYRESDMDNLGGSFYRAIVNTICCGNWDHSLQYEHGFRVGGILAVGFCQYINKIISERKIDKVLFCARDCSIIYQIYNSFYKKTDTEYLQISRYAILKATSERYLYDLSNRYIMRYVDKFRSTKTIETILIESGFGYLVSYLEDDDIDRFLFPVAIDKKRIEQFIYKHKDIITKNNQTCVTAAKKYFEAVIGDAKNILVVDIGWSGTCITAFKYFCEKHFNDKKINIFGALMCTSRGKALTNSLNTDEIDAYIASPFQNMDITRHIMPGGAAGRSEKKQALLHMPLEFLFTSLDDSLVSYSLNDNGEIVFERGSNSHANSNEIIEMQQGMMDFAAQFKNNTKGFEKYFSVSPYVAFNPLRAAMGNAEYIKEVYKDFTYDVASAPFSDVQEIVKFVTILDDDKYSAEKLTLDPNRKNILFVTPELTYTGTPRSLLRMCKVAKKLGYIPYVWSSKSGPFITEYKQNDIAVEVVPERELSNRNIVSRLKKFDMAICNTIVTDKYAKLCSRYMPTVWYIREATNIPDFLRDNREREYELNHSRDIYCVSKYAADAIRQFTKHKISVVHNSVEDEVDLAVDYRNGSSDKVRFVQFGTMEYRKGYDVVIEAYRRLPEEYKNRIEIFFAGGFINSGAPYCSYIFSKMKGLENIHYLGVVKGEENKIKTLSSMDVVIVASRDESCSLVALEGAMLSKPLIVTENVGAKYIVSDKNGFIVKTGDAEALKNAIINMVDKKNELESMGRSSRKMYEKHASMEAYTQELKRLFELSNKKDSISFRLSKLAVRIENSNVLQTLENRKCLLKEKIGNLNGADVVVSLTSHPGRINTVKICIESLLSQTKKPRKIILYLSKEQFPTEDCVPKDLVDLTTNPIFQIKFVEDDIKPHKKYYYAMREYPDLPVIIVDDDVIYEKTLIEKLMNSYKKFPHSISAMRANLIMFKDNGNLRRYDGWLMGYRSLLDTPSYQLMPTGVGGVLYPPHSVPESAFDINAIKETCLYTDDLWLKMHVVHNGYTTVVPRDYSKYKEIEGTRETALWRINVHQNNNDSSIEQILAYFKKRGIGNLLEVIRKDRFC